MRKILLSALLLSSAGFAAELSNMGVANFASCLTESKTGKKEQENLENMRKQMSSLVEDTNKELTEIAAKFEDPEYLDSLSPKAEEDLKAKFESLQQDLGRYQNQFYQVLNHAHYQMMQKVGANIAKASEKVALEKQLDCIVNREHYFYISPDFDVTSSVIAEMDVQYDLESKSARKTAENDEVTQAQDNVVDQQAE